jgi:hypothetical protein
MVLSFLIIHSVTVSLESLVLIDKPMHLSSSFPQKQSVSLLTGSIFTQIQAIHSANEQFARRPNVSPWCIPLLLVCFLSPPTSQMSSGQLLVLYRVRPVNLTRILGSITPPILVLVLSQPTPMCHIPTLILTLHTPRILQVKWRPSCPFMYHTILELILQIIIIFLLYIFQHIMSHISYLKLI